jgi:hypothetical protein
MGWHDVCCFTGEVVYMCYTLKETDDGGGIAMDTFKKFDEYVEYAINNSDRASELIAKSFYKILRKNGFDNSQIINTANNILDCLIKSLDGYKEKISNDSEKKTRKIRPQPHDSPTP